MTGVTGVEFELISGSVESDGEDIYWELAELLAASSSLLSGARFVEISDAGHSPYFEHPGAWNEAVLSFLRST